MPSNVAETAEAPGETDSGVEAEAGQLAQRHACSHCEMETIKCHDYQRKHFGSWSQELRHTIWEAATATSEGCPFFLWLCNKIKRSNTPKEQLQRTTIVFDFHTRPGHQEDITSVTVVLRTLHYSWSVGGFTVVSDHDDQSAGFAVARMIEGSVASLEAIKQIRRRLGECLRGHPDCRQQNPHVRPPRVIDVYSSGLDTVRLHTLEPTRLDPYAALSYCWGASQAVKTTVSSLATHEAGIPVASLPQTLQDAIRVTREIGINYLWVDSLCIVQDSPKELAKEVADMSHYYGNALVTLSASASESCMDGFLHDRAKTPQPLVGPFFFFPIQRCGHSKSSGSLKFVFSAEAAEVIDARAWTLQEGLLSSRLVSFGAMSIRWSCRTTTYGEVFHSSGARLRSELSGIRRAVGEEIKRGGNLDWAADKVDYFQRAVDHSLFPRESRWKALRLWSAAVDDYTSRVLAVDDDKLPAISGIAREFASMLPPAADKDLPKYLAGLWAGPHLPFQLLWIPRGVGSRPAGYVAPSWSWASVKGPISTGVGRDPQNEMLGVERCDLKIDSVSLGHVSSEAPYGALHSATMTVSGLTLTGNSADFSSLYVRLPFDTREDQESAKTASFFTCLQVLGRNECGGGILEKPNNLNKLPKGLVLVKNEDETYGRVGVYFQQYREAGDGEDLFSLGASRTTLTIV